MLKFFDMFAGAGGFRYALEKAGFECVGSCEINKQARKFYTINFKTENEVYYADATAINTSTMPDFDILVGGFPCQSFSIAGKRRGFEDVRGTLFFDLARVLKDKRPRYFLLENVKGLLNHDGGETFATIVGTLADIGYRVEWALLNSKYFGVPQNRERVFIVGRLGEECSGQIFPLALDRSENNATSKNLTEFIYWKNSKEKWIKENRANTPTIKTQSDLCRQPLIIDDYNGRVTAEIGTVTKQCGSASARNGYKIIQLGRGKNDGGIKDIAPTVTANEYAYNNLIVGTMRTYNTDKGFRPIKDNSCPTIPARAREDGSGQPCVAIPVLTPDRINKRQNGRRNKNNNDEMFTLTAQDTHGVLLSDSSGGGALYDAKINSVGVFSPAGLSRYFCRARLCGRVKGHNIIQIGGQRRNNKRSICHSIKIERG